MEDVDKVIAGDYTGVEVEEVKVPEDNGSHLLYKNEDLKFPFKTSERLLDDLLCDLRYIEAGENYDDFSDLKSGILRAPVLRYSKLRRSVDKYRLGSITDQIAIQTKFEYESITCPKYNKINVFMGVLFDFMGDDETIDDLPEVQIYHVKISVKSRINIERFDRQKSGVSRFFSVDNLHEFDKPDFFTFDKENPNLIDYAIYVSENTNKLILIELFKPEFNSEEEKLSLTQSEIRSHYETACERIATLDPNSIPTPADVLNTMFKIFKGPLSRKSTDDIVKKLDLDNPQLNAHINPDRLVSKYGFQLQQETDDETGEEYFVLEPPNLVNYKNDSAVRLKREEFTRKCLELIFLGKIAIAVMTNEMMDASAKSLRAFNMIQTSLSTNFWSHLVEQNKMHFENEGSSYFDVDHHFIALVITHSYSDKEIINNFELQSKYDEKNIKTYYDSLLFVANSKGSYQLIKYCGKLDIVGSEELETALKTFNLNPTTVDLREISDSVFSSVYESEIKNITGPSQSNRQNALRNALKIIAKAKHSEKLKFYVDYEPLQTVSQAYNMLEVDESVDEDIIQTAYTIKVNDAPGLKMNCDRALYTIAIAKRSIKLVNFLLEICPEFLRFYGPSSFSYNEALAYLQVNENANDETVLEIFQKKWFNDYYTEKDHLLILKAALSKIGEETNSKLINHFLATGLIDSSCLPVENWPAGLNNIGNTCYLNSLLQYYFSIVPVREYVSEYHQTPSEMEGTMSNQSQIRRIGGREVTYKEVERSVQFIYQLRDLFIEMMMTQSRCVTPRRELAYLAFAPSNVEVEFESTSSQTLKNELNEHPDHFDKKVDLISMDSPMEEEQNLIDFDSNNSEVDQEPTMEDQPTPNDTNEKDVEKKSLQEVETRVAKISPDQLENALEMGRQQDVTECVGNVLFQLESGSNPIDLDEDHEQNDIIKQLFYGRTKQTITPLNAEKNVRTKIERFLSLLVNVSDHPTGVYDALDLYFNDEFIEMDEYGEVRKSLTITEFPSILQIQIQRVYYDRQKFMPFKSIEALPFTDKLYMDRYSETSDSELIQRRNETNDLKNQLKEMRKRQKQLLSKNELGLSRKEAFIETKKYLESNVLTDNEVTLDNKDKLLVDLEKLIKGIDEELSTLFNQIAALEIKIDHQFDEFQNIGYTLFAVFIHRGEASYGHYWIYIKDFEKNGIWRKYNDETVTEVPESEVFNFAEGNTATPYFLVYVQEGKESSIQPLNRVVHES